MVCKEAIFNYSILLASKHAAKRLCLQLCYWIQYIYIYMHIHNIFTLSKSWNAKSTSSAAGCSDAFQLEALFRRLDENGVGSCAPEESAQTKTRETKSLRNDVEGTFINGPCAAPGTC